MKYLIYASAIASLLFVYLCVTQDADMKKCEQHYSHDTCFYSLNH